MTESEAARRRATQNGSGVERVAPLPTSLTILGAASLLGLVQREVITLVREGTWNDTAAARHLHIDRDPLAGYRSAR